MDDRFGRREPIPNLELRLTSESVWLHFTTQSGLQTDVNVQSFATQPGAIVSQALMEWCAERRVENNKRQLSDTAKVSNDDEM
jgi:hypothetical protein